MGFNPGGGGGSTVIPIATGLAAARPAASGANASTGYYATDTGELTVSTGAAWQTINQTSHAFSMWGNSVISTGGYLFFDLGNAIALRSQGGNELQLAAGSFDIAGVGGGVKVAEGANAKQGTATLVAGTVTVANTSITATSRIMLTPQDNNTAGALRVSARVAGISFTILSSNAADTGVVAYEIFEVG